MHRSETREKHGNRRTSPGLLRLIATIEGARWIVPALFAVAIGLRLAVMLLLPQHPTSDGEWYMVRAAEMARGMGYQEAGHPTAFWPVGYPALLAGSMMVFGASTFGPLLLNLIAATVILALILAFGRSLEVDPFAVRIAALLYAIYPAHIAYAGQPCSETVSTAVIMGAFVLLVARRGQWWGLALAGLLFGAGTLMRAQTMLFPVGALVAMAICLPDFGWRRAVRAALPVYLALALVVLPWSLRNLDQMGSFIPVSTNGGIALYYGANDHATGDWYAWERTPVWDESGIGIRYADRVARQVDLDRGFKAMAKDWIAAHPLEWTMLGFRKAALVWLKDSDGFWSLDATYPEAAGAWKAVEAANQLYYMLLVALAAGALAIGGRAALRGERGRMPMLLLGCMPAFVTLTAFGFTGQTRYHYPAMPFVMITAAWLLAVLVRRWAARADASVTVEPAPPLAATA